MMAGKTLPMPILERLLEVATDTKLPGHAINVFAFLAQHADESGDIAVSTVPGEVGATLGLSQSTVYRVYSVLKDAGYVEWLPTQSVEAKKRGLKGSIRIALPGHE